jgi:hypothetical protein
MGILMTVTTFVVGAVIREAQEIRFQRAQERAQAELTAEEIEAEHERFQQWFQDSGDFPRITRMVKTGFDPDDPATRDERFQFGLDCVLDGIAAQVAASRATAGQENGHD